MGKEQESKISSRTMKHPSTESLSSIQNVDEKFGIKEATRKLHLVCTSWLMHLDDDWDPEQDG
jgi:hypothetical protein